MSGECPRQLAFVKHLDELLISYHESMKDRFSVDEADKYIDIYIEKKKWFTNLWCPTSKEYQEL